MKFLNKGIDNEVGSGKGLRRNFFIFKVVIGELVEKGNKVSVYELRDWWNEVRSGGGRPKKGDRTVVIPGKHRGRNITRHWA